MSVSDAHPVTGLTEEEAARRAANGESNRRGAEPGKTVGQIVASNLFTFFNGLNVLLALALALVGSFHNMLFMGVVISNTVIGTVQ